MQTLAGLSLAPEHRRGHGALYDAVTRALTATYTPYHADDALTRLAWLLNVRLTGHSDEAFRRWGLAEELGIEQYRAAVGRLWDKLVWYEFEEAVPPLGYRSGLIAILPEFTQDLFGGAAEAAGKRTWREKTPFNLLSVRFLLELFPEATVVVIMRHPVEVAASHLDQPWAPSTLDGVLGWLEPVYQRWLAQRPALPKRPPVRRGESREPRRTLAHQPTRAVQPSWAARRRHASIFAPIRLVSWRAQLSDNQQAEIVSRLGWAADELGYPAGP